MPEGLRKGSSHGRLIIHILLNQPEAALSPRYRRQSLKIEQWIAFNTLNLGSRTRELDKSYLVGIN